MNLRTKGKRAQALWPTLSCLRYGLCITDLQLAVCLVVRLAVRLAVCLVSGQISVEILER